jgi:thioredoxin 1
VDVLFSIVGQFRNTAASTRTKPRDSSGKKSSSESKSPNEPPWFTISQLAPHVTAEGHLPSAIIACSAGWLRILGFSGGVIATPRLLTILGRLSVRCGLAVTCARDPLAHSQLLTRFQTGAELAGEGSMEDAAMPFDPTYREQVPTREEIDQTEGLLVLEFGAGWCGHCEALSPAVEALLSARPEVQHLRVADGRGKRLGRSFRVKLWPTLVFLKDGKVMAELVRPTGAEVRRTLEEVEVS